MSYRRVVVTGLGAITPLGNNVQTYWNSLMSGVSGAVPITRFDTSKFKTRFACEVKGFDPEIYMDRKESRKLDRFSQFAVAAAEEAVQDSNIDLDKIDKEKVGVIWGSGIGGLETYDAELEYFYTNDKTPRFNPFFIPKMIIDIAAGHISIRYGFKGLNYATVSACASSANAIIDGFNYLRMGKANIIFAGGSEAAITASGIGGFSAMKALSQRNDEPATASRPFDLDRDGFVLGEGGGVLVLEELEHAKARGAKIYAELVGAGLTADAYHITAPHPEGEGAMRVMQLALDDAELTPADINYINVHGTSTRLGDISETLAIKAVFAEHTYNLNISSTKSMTGQLLGAAGVIEAIACILAVKYNRVPPTINHFTDDPDIDGKLNLTFNEPQDKKVKAALSNTFGFGGHNASLIFKKFVD